MREKIINLRKVGKTYSEINKILNLNIPKSTLSYWCKGVVLPKTYHEKIEKLNIINRAEGRKIALKRNREKRKTYFYEIQNRMFYLFEKLRDKNTALIALAVLFLGEGSKTSKGSLVFGNSNPSIIRLFLKLLRYCYNIDESKLRCTFQGRADQNIEELEKFWSRVTRIPLVQFYRARIDPRTVGKKTRKYDYKGVCRIEYFSANVFWEIKTISEILCQNKGL